MSSEFIVKKVYYNNKSRKGIYYRTTYKDMFNKKHTSIVKKSSMSETKFVNYVNTTQNFKNPKQRKKYLRTIKQTIKRDRVKSKELKKESDKIKEFEQKEKSQDLEEKLKTKKNWSAEREQSRNTLMSDNKNPLKKSDAVYEVQELAIILKIGKTSELSSMSEERFRRKLNNYMPSKSREQDKFLNDIVNKWGSEFKN